MQARERDRDGPCSGSIDHAHEANRFLLGWFAAGSSGVTAQAQGDVAAEELRACSNELCGRRETRQHEFRRCTVCTAVNYAREHARPWTGGGAT
jgi:hypothetical protein